MGYLKCYAVKKKLYVKTFEYDCLESTSSKNQLANSNTNFKDLQL